MNFYSNYIALCNKIGKSPSGVALELGLAKATVNRWKNGGKPTDATAIKIANYFDVPVSTLIEGTISLDEMMERVATDATENRRPLQEIIDDAQKKESTVNDDGLPEVNRELIEMVRNLSQRDAALLLAALKANRSR